MTLVGAEFPREHGPTGYLDLTGFSEKVHDGLLDIVAAHLRAEQIVLIHDDGTRETISADEVGP